MSDIWRLWVGHALRDARRSRNGFSRSPFQLNNKFDERWVLELHGKIL
jgi:hypothetical protein